MRAQKISAIAVIALMVFVSSCSMEKGQSILTITAIEPSSDPFGDIITNEGGIPSDTVEISLFNDLKNPSDVTNTVYANINIDSVTVTFTRNDGGKDVPASYRHAIQYVVPAEGSLTIENFPIIPATMKAQFPISDLLTFGYERSTNYTSIKLNCTLEISGKTVEGDPVYAKGSISIELTNWAD